MTRRIELPGGGWAEMKTPSELTEKDRRTLRKAGSKLFAVRAQIRAAGLQKPAAELTADENEQVLEITFGSDAVSDQNATFVAVYTVTWSYETPPTMDSVLDLPGPVFDLLVSEATKGDRAAKMAADGTPVVDPNEMVDPASPTVPSTV